MHGFIAQIKRILSQDLLPYLNASFFIDLLENVKCEMSISIFFVANPLRSWKYHNSIVPLPYIDLVLRYVPTIPTSKFGPDFIFATI